MTAVTVQPGNPSDRQATALLKASHALMQSLFPSESNHFLPIEALKVPNIRFFTATLGNQTLGCAALAIKDGYGEVKSMFVAPEARGTGIGAALLARLEAETRAHDIPALRLETGNSLYAAHRLYERHGFTLRGPFGDYPDGPLSLFMEKPLT